MFVYIFQIRGKHENYFKITMQVTMLIFRRNYFLFPKIEFCLLNSNLIFDQQTARLLICSAKAVKSCSYNQCRSYENRNKIV